MAVGEPAASVLATRIVWRESVWPVNPSVTAKTAVRMAAAEPAANAPGATSALRGSARARPAPVLVVGNLSLSVTAMASASNTAIAAPMSVRLVRTSVQVPVAIRWGGRGAAMAIPWSGARMGN